jgi:hypothetical protein
MESAQAIGVDENVTIILMRNSSIDLFICSVIQNYDFDMIYTFIPQG